MMVTNFPAHIPINLIAILKKEELFRSFVVVVVVVVVVVEPPAGRETRFSLPGASCAPGQNIAFLSLGSKKKRQQAVQKY